MVMTSICARCKKKLHPFDQTFTGKDKIYHLECAARRGLLRKWKWWKNPNGYDL